MLNPLAGCCSPLVFTCATNRYKADGTRKSEAEVQADEGSQILKLVVCA
jgi:hypothetical protein